MSPVWNESLLRTIGRWGLTLLVILVLLVFSFVPLEIAHLGEIRPDFMLMAVYYWTIVRPSLLTPVAVFFIGLILDLLCGYPLGMNALVLVIVQWLTRSQHKFLLGQSFLLIWAGFLMMALGSGIVKWLLFSLFNMGFISIEPMLMSVVLSTLLFPVLVLPLSIVHKALANDPSSVL